jgi:hypothetical protein
VRFLHRWSSGRWWRCEDDVGVWFSVTFLARCMLLVPILLLFLILVICFVLFVSLSCYCSSEIEFSHGKKGSRTERRRWGVEFVNPPRLKWVRDGEIGRDREK